MAEGFGDVAEKLRRSTVHVRVDQGREQGSGSGVIWTSDGLIVTNSHVVRGERACVELWDGRRFEGRVAAHDTRRDLATLRIAARSLPAATYGDSNSIRVGELVLAVGNPMGFIGALTTGIVHAQGPLRALGRQTWVQASVRLAPGNSGGPLADARGRVIGINTMVVSGGLALAVPSNAIVEFLNRAARPALGITVRPVGAGSGSKAGLLILEVSPHGPAAAASLLMGDLLTGVNGRPIQSLDDLNDALDAPTNGTLSLQFQRGDRKSQREVVVRLAAQAAA